MGQGQTKAFTATLTNDTGSKGVNWALSGTSCTGATCGTLTSVTTTSATYNAPATVAANLVVTLAATSIADGTKSASLNFTVVPAPTVTTTSLAAATKNASYSATLTASGGAQPFTWSIHSGALPTGFTLNTSTGVISGTATTVGTFNFTIQVADACSPALTATKALSITVNPPPLAITTTSLPNGTQDSVYAATLATTGGTTPITWSIGVPPTGPHTGVIEVPGALPAGLTLNASTGVISGTPTVSGTYSFNVIATDSASTPQTASQNLSISLNPSLSIESAVLPDGAVNTAYTTTIASLGGTSPVTWSIAAGTLPAGLTLHAGTGVISGTPTAVGNSSFTVEASDNSNPVQTAQKALSITVATAPLVISSTSLANGTIGIAYTATLTATGGTPPVTWSISGGELPGWASLDSGTGAITGTPTGSPATTNFTVEASDSSSPVQTQTQALSITTVNGGSNNSELNGHYMYMLRGFDSMDGHGFITRVGSFVADGSGIITGGVEDVNSTTSIHSNQAITGGYYSIGSDHRGTLSITTAQGTSTFSFVLGSMASGVSQGGRLIETDTQVLTGQLKKQDTSAFSTASITGSFAFGVGGMESTGRFAGAGVMAFDGNGTFTASMDVNGSGSVNTGSFDGTYALGDAVNGRGTITDTTNGSHMAFYVVSATETTVTSVEAYSNDGPPLFTGSAQKQSGSFSNASLNGNVVYMTQSAANSSGGTPTSSYTGLGLFTANGAGGITAFVMDENDGGAISDSTGSGTYSIASNGRMTMTINSKAMPIVFYLVGPGKAFSMGTNGAVGEGVLKPQPAATFNDATLTGAYIFGAEPPVLYVADLDIGVVTLDGAGHMTGTVEKTQGGSNSLTHPITDTYSVASNGRVVLGDSVIYIIAPSKAVMMSIVPNVSDATIHMIEMQ